MIFFFSKIWFHFGQTLPTLSSAAIIQVIDTSRETSSLCSPEAASVNTATAMATRGTETGYREHTTTTTTSPAWFYCRYFRRSAEISCLPERLNLVTDSLYFIHIMRHLDARVSLNYHGPARRFTFWKRACKVPCEVVTINNARVHAGFD